MWRICPAPHHKVRRKIKSFCAQTLLLNLVFPFSCIGGVKPFCIIHSDLGQFDVDDFEEEKGHRFTGGQTHRVANYQFKVFKGAADIRLELWFRGKKRSEEKSIKVHWNHKLIRDEVS